MNLIELALPPPSPFFPIYLLLFFHVHYYLLFVCAERRRCTCIFFFTFCSSRECGWHTYSGLPRRPHYLLGHKSCELRDDDECARQRIQFCHRWERNLEDILCSSCEFSVHVKQDEVTRDQYKLLGVVETFLEMMRVSQKMNWICLRTQQMKGAVALILTIAAAFSCMV